MYGENICAFPHILGSASSYMTLHPIPSDFNIDEKNFVFFFISVGGRAIYCTAKYKIISSKLKKAFLFNFSENNLMTNQII